MPVCGYSCPAARHASSGTSSTPNRSAVSSRPAFDRSIRRQTAIQWMRQWKLWTNWCSVQCVHVAAQLGWQTAFVPKLRKLETRNGALSHLGLLSTDDGANTLSTTSSKPQAQSLITETLINYRSCVCYWRQSATRTSVRSVGPGLSGPSTLRRKKPPPRLLLTPIGSESLGCWVGVHQEIRTDDAMANPYVTLGAFLVAGMRGAQRELPLPLAGNQDPATIPEVQSLAALSRFLDQASEAVRERKEPWRGILTPSCLELLLVTREEYPVNQLSGAIMEYATVQASWFQCS